MNGRLPSVQRPRHGLAGMPGRNLVQWVRLLVVLALAGALLWALIAYYRPRLPPDRAGSSTAPAAFSELQHGYNGPPVIVGVVGQRSRALGGLCVAIVRDASSSVSSGIDPDGQVNEELATIAEAFAVGGLVADRVVGVVFAAGAKSTGAVAPGDPTVRSVLTSSPGEDGTSFSDGLGAAGDSLSGCPAGATRAVILVSDGESNSVDVNTGLSALPDDATVHFVALDGGGWPSTARLWGAVGTRATIVRRLDGGVVAMAVNRIMSELTGQNFTTGFDTEGAMS